MGDAAYKRMLNNGAWSEPVIDENGRIYVVDNATKKLGLV
jgi:hypothetical protein